MESLTSSGCSIFVGFRTGLDDVPELSGVGLEGHADLVGAVLRCGIRVAPRSGVSAAAGCEALPSLLSSALPEVSFS